MSAWLAANPTVWILLNTAHILGIALLLGSVLPLDLRLLGAFSGLPRAPLAHVLRRTAATGLALALATGPLLFAANPAAYLENQAFRLKLLLLAAAILNILLADRVLRRLPDDAPVPPALRLAAALSALLWLSVLLAGRWIGFL